MSDLRRRLLAAVAGKEDGRQNAESRCDGDTPLIPFENAGVAPSPSATRQFPNLIRAVTPSHSDFGNQPYRKVVAALSERCPDLVEDHRWRNAVADATAFLRQWGQQAAALGWMARNLFGLAEIPERPSPNYQRLSRYDQTGLVWQLQGRQVVELTKDKAVIETATGTVSFYRARRDEPRANRGHHSRNG
jgi:hypothetical protein